MKQSIRLVLGILVVLGMFGNSPFIEAKTLPAKKAVIKTSTKKVLVKKKVSNKKTAKKKKKSKRRKEVLNLNPPLIDPTHPPGGR